MKINIAVIGLGNIGKRHLQAVANLEDVAEIICFDINPDARGSLKHFCDENSIPMGKIKLLSDMACLLKAVKEDSIAIVATTAKTRADIIQNLIRCKPYAIIAEKPLCRTRDEFDAITASSAAAKVPIYVNLARRMFDYYDEIFTETRNSERKMFKASFSGGISCIGIHMFDLAAWLMGARRYDILSSEKRETYETKRPGFSDFSGSLIVDFDKGNIGLFHAVKDNNLFSIGISTDTREYVVYEGLRKMVVSDIKGNIEVRPFSIPMVSHTTAKVVKDILSGHKPTLPDIHEASISHSILFDFIRRHGLEEVSIT